MSVKELHWDISLRVVSRHYDGPWWWKCGHPHQAAAAAALAAAGGAVVVQVQVQVQVQMVVVVVARCLVSRR